MIGRPLLDTVLEFERHLACTVLNVVSLLEQCGEDSVAAHGAGHRSGTARTAGRGPEQDPRHSSGTGQGS